LFGGRARLGGRRPRCARPLMPNGRSGQFVISKTELIEILAACQGDPMVRLFNDHTKPVAEPPSLSAQAAAELVREHADEKLFVEEQYGDSFYIHFGSQYFVQLTVREGSPLIAPLKDAWRRWGLEVERQQKQKEGQE